MVIVMDVDKFSNFKEDINIGALDPLIIQKINSMFLTYNQGNRKNNSKKNENKLIHMSKNVIFKDLKKKIETKINFILNKITKSNIDDILIEFCENISITTLKDFKDITILFWKKMILHSGFSEIYFTFFRKIIILYSHVFDFEINLSYFIDIVETKFLMDYKNITSDIEKLINNELKIPEDLTEEESCNYKNNYKFNNMNIIKILINQDLLDISIKQFVKSILFVNNYYSYDIYNWFSSNLLEQEKNDIKNYLDTNINIPLRDKYLLEDLIKDKNKDIKLEVFKKNKDNLQVEVSNLLEEYFFINEVEEIELFVIQKCGSSTLKNNFSKYILDFYFLNKEKHCKNIIELLKYLLNKKILFKSNLSRGLVLIYKTWNICKFDYPNHNLRMKKYLLFLNNQGITRGIENIFKVFI
jgi:hypothetical protein